MNFQPNFTTGQLFLYVICVFLVWLTGITRLCPGQWSWSMNQMNRDRQSQAICFFIIPLFIFRICTAFKISGEPKLNQRAGNSRPPNQGAPVPH